MNFKKRSSSSNKNRTSESVIPITGGPRIPPHSAEAEESVIGGILLDNECLNTAVELVSADDFYSPSHQIIFSAMTSLWDKREPIDIITLSQKLRSLDALEEIGGMDGLTRLASLVPSTAHLEYYARLVKEHSLRRRVIREASSVIQEAFSVEQDIETFLDTTEQRILAVSDYRVSPSFHRAGDVVQDSIKLIEQLFDRKELVTGVPTGFQDLDKMTAGFQPSDLIIIAARPSMGKTALALSIASYVGITGPKGGVAIFSLEMSKEQLVLRMLCSLAHVDNSKVRTGHLEKGNFSSIVNAAGQIAEGKVFIDDTGGLTITELRAKCRRLHKECPLSLVIVDYLQLMRSPAYGSFREQEISDISRSLKALAKELSVPVIALSQLNRSVESRDDKRPRMSDLRESGAIEQDADIIAFIYRDEVYKPDTTEQGIAEIIISKQRNGPTGTVKLAFSAAHTRFDNYYHEPLGAGGPLDYDNAFASITNDLMSGAGNTSHKFG
jgi:replicative DNA helicase